MPFHPLDFIVIDFMQVNDCESRRREGAMWTVYSKGRTKEGGVNDRGRVERTPTGAKQGGVR